MTAKPHRRPFVILSERDARREGSHRFNGDGGILRLRLRMTGAPGKTFPEASIASGNGVRNIVIASRCGSLPESRSARDDLGVAATETPTVAALLRSASPSG
jgi:hypothetical protein